MPVGINYRLNVHRLQANTEMNSGYVFELQYADDAALPSHSAEGLQRNLDDISATCKSTGLLVNVRKTSGDPASTVWSPLCTSCLYG